MKRLNRDPSRFDLLELYTSLSREQGYRIDTPTDLDKFHSKLQSSLKATLSNPALLHGKRVEAMFAHVIGALGMCKHIKQEDGGAMFAEDDDYEVPDYRVVTSSGELLLIEVKNFHMRSLGAPYTLKRAYLKKLQAYADVNRAQLKIALYFSRINKWALLSPDAFFVDSRTAYIDLVHAFARNEFASLGDRMIATLPPLTLQLVGDTDEKAAIVAADGTVAFTIRDVRMYCAGNEITNKHEQDIAFRLMRYGKWSETETPAEIVNGRLVSVSFISRPEPASENQQFEIVGDLSSMVSTAFRELTADNGAGVFALDVGQDPQAFSIRIPKNYKGEALPLWQFAIEPNFNPITTG